MKNYEVCCEDCSEWPLNQEDVIKCAIQMERKALRSCMVVILYQRAMTRLVSVKLTGHVFVLYGKTLCFSKFIPDFSLKV